MAPLFVDSNSICRWKDYNFDSFWAHYSLVQKWAELSSSSREKAQTLFGQGNFLAAAQNDSSAMKGGKSILGPMQDPSFAAVNYW